MYSGMKDENSRSVVKPHATRGERFAMPYVRRPGKPNLFLCLCSAFALIWCVLFGVCYLV